MGESFSLLVSLSTEKRAYIYTVESVVIYDAFSLMGLIWLKVVNACSVFESICQILHINTSKRLVSSFPNTDSCRFSKMLYKIKQSASWTIANTNYCLKGKTAACSWTHQMTFINSFSCCKAVDRLLSITKMASRYNGMAWPPCTGTLGQESTTIVIHVHEGKCHGKLTKQNKSIKF